MGIGWSYVFKNHTILSLEDSYRALKELEEKERKMSGAVKTLMDEVKEGDLVWIHQAGDFFLCKVSDNEPVLGAAIDKEYQEYDLGHARNAKWVLVPEVLVSGHVQRCTIAPRTIQRIRCSEAEKESFNFMHSELARDPQWFPDMDETETGAMLRTTPYEELLELLSPDDHEDLVAAYLQFQGWTLVKSTCYRSKPKFEFRMVRAGPSFAHVQVKSGRVPLMPSEYRNCVSEGDRVFLYSTHEMPYPGNPESGVETLSPRQVLQWAESNPWALPTGFKIRLQIKKELLGGGDEPRTH